MTRSFGEKNGLALLNLYQEELVGETGPSEQYLREFMHSPCQPCVLCTDLIPTGLLTVAFDIDELPISFDAFRERYVDRLQRLHYYVEQLIKQINDKEKTND
jgi:hypothetical protein